MFKRIIAIVLALILCLSCTACGASASQTEPTLVATEADPLEGLDLSEFDLEELRFAQKMGLPLDYLDQDNVSSSQLAQLLDAFVAYAAPEKLESWQALYPLARKSSSLLKKIDAMLYLYLAAVHVGGDYGTYDQSALIDGASVQVNWGDLSPNWTLYGKIVDLGTPPTPDGETQWNKAAYWFNYSCISPISGEYPFPINHFSNTFSTLNDPTYRDCVLAVARLTAAVEGYVPPSKVLDRSQLSEADQAELAYAESMGLPMSLLSQDSITAFQMMELMNAFIAYAAPEKLDSWMETSDIRLWNHSVTLTRMDALTYLRLAAYHLGGNYSFYEQQALGIGLSVEILWEESWISNNLFGDASQLDDIYSHHFGNLTFVAASYYFNFSHISPISGDYLFSIDRENYRFLSEVRPTYLECVLAVARLAAAAERYRPEREVTEAEQPYLAQIDARREEIQSAATDMSAYITGTTYYVSNSGSDDNDGLTPETAWATLERVANQPYQDGDGVLFERGGQWNCYDFNQNFANDNSHGELPIYKKVSYGAYGEGPKPILRGDVSGASDPANWELHYDAEGKKIWRYIPELIDVNVIVFNEGEFWAEEVMPWWDGKDSYINPDQTSFVLEEALEQDLTFSCLQDSVNVLYQMGVSQKFTLYLRCDNGNPAVSFDSIHIPNVGMPIMVSNGSAACDLDIRYFTTSGTAINDEDNTQNGGQVFRNLEISWCGGFLLEYDNFFHEDPTAPWQPRIAGGGIALSGVNNVTVEGCWFYQVAPMTTILSLTTKSVQNADYHDIHIHGNLFEHCGVASYWADWSAVEQPGTSASLENYVFEDNIAAYTGDGWFTSSIIDSYFGGVNAAWTSAVGVSAGTTNNGIFIRNNLFLHSIYAMVTLEETGFDWVTPVNSQPTFSGNTYVQRSGFPLLQTSRQSYTYYPTEEIMKNYLGDTTGTLVVIE